MAMSVIQACRSLALSTWLLSFCFVHLLCLDFTVAEKEEWYTALVNITYPDPGGGGGELRSEKSEWGRYGERSPKHDTGGQVAMTSAAADRQACDPNARFAAPGPGKTWIALIPKGNCSLPDKIRHAAAQNASAVVIYNAGAGNTNETFTMPYAGEWRAGGRAGGRPGAHSPSLPIRNAAGGSPFSCSRTAPRTPPSSCNPISQTVCY